MYWDKPNLRITTGNRLEILLGDLAETVRKPLGDPLSPETIVVQSRGMARWVAMGLAVQNGISANNHFPFPNAFLEEIFRALFNECLDLSPYEPDILACRVMRILPEKIGETGFEDVRSYLEDDAHGLRLYQLSKKIADTYDQYLIFRPEMIRAWEKGKAGHWQARLWRRLATETSIPHRAQNRYELFKRIRSGELDGSLLPGRISVFGISYLPRFYIHTFIMLAEIIEVNLYILNPCRSYWGDIVSSDDIQRVCKRYATGAPQPTDLHLEKGNPLLAAMGSQGRDFLSVLGVSDFDFLDRFHEPDGNSLLSCIQWDILNLVDRRPVRVNHLSDREGSESSSAELKPHIPSDSPSIQVHSCHSPLREVEVLRDSLLSMFEADPELTPSDILIMAPDIVTYSPYFRSIFDPPGKDGPKIPFSIADVRKTNGKRTIEGFLALLNLKDSRLGVPDVMRLLESECIVKQFGLFEADRRKIENWLRDTHVRWGLDEGTRIQLGLPGIRDNTWRAGIERLILGYAMPESEEFLFAGILPYDHIEGGDAKTLGKLLTFLDHVFGAVERLNKKMPLSEWRITLLDLIDTFFAADGEDEYDVQTLRDICIKLETVQTVSDFREPVSLDVIRHMIDTHLEKKRVRGGFLTGNVTCCEMLPMRSIPAKIVCLMGMNSDAFPRNDRKVGFDFIRRYPRPGDRSRRNDDKYLFLEAIISARSRLYISYVGQSIDDNSTIPPSVLISELLDYVSEGFGIPEQDVVVRHKLHAFSPSYFTAGNRLFSYSKTAHAGAVRTGRTEPPSPFIETALPEMSEALKSVDLETICDFFSHPAKSILQKRLGIFFDTGPGRMTDKENFDLDLLERYKLNQDLVRARLRRSDWRKTYPFHKAEGGLPQGNVGEAVFRNLDAEAGAFVRKIDEKLPKTIAKTTKLELDVGGIHVTGEVSDLYTDGIVGYRYASIRAVDRLYAWIRHLAVCSLFEETTRFTSVFYGKNKQLRFNYVKESRQVMEELLSLYVKGMSEPLHFFPGSSLVYVQQRSERRKPREAALDTAMRHWQGNDFKRGEGEDPYYHLCFRHGDPLDRSFEEISETIYTPLLAHCEENNF